MPPPGHSGAAGTSWPPPSAMCMVSGKVTTTEADHPPVRRRCGDVPVTFVTPAGCAPVPALAQPRPATKGVPGDEHAALGPRRLCPAGLPVTAEGAEAARRGDPLEELSRELDEARETLRAIRAGGVDALVIDTGSGGGEELFRLSGAARAMEELRRELEQVRETLRAIRAGRFDALVIDADGGEEEVFALGGAGRPYRLLAGGIAAGGSATSGRWPSISTAPWLTAWSRRPRWPRSPRRGPGESG